MKFKFTALLCAALLFLSGCAVSSGAQDNNAHIVATSYPVYIFAMNVLEGSEGIELELLVDQQISCIHDYTLSVNDMMRLEDADLLLMSGAGLEEFLEGALKSYPDLPTADCSAGVELLTLEDGEPDPHIWLDPRNAITMTENLTAALVSMYPDQAELFQENCSAYTEKLARLYDDLYGEISGLRPEIITFHDGFAYFARAFGITILHSIEEEAGSEASAAEINEIIGTIDSHPLAVIFTETNGSDSTARAIAAETGVSMGVLSTAVSGEKTASGYEDILRDDVDSIITTIASQTLKS